jgi:hypothetical protein
VDKVPNFAGFEDRAVPDVNQAGWLGCREVLNRSERWSIGQKIAGALVSFASAGLLLGIGSQRVVIAAVLGLVGVSS